MACVTEVANLAIARHLLCERLQHYLHDLDPVLREDAGVVLAVEGKLLHQPALALDGRWALLPFCLIQDLRATTRADFIDTNAACDVALAMECVICATDLLDDVMDDDVTPLIERLGMARALNAALTLVSLSQRMLLALLDGGLPTALSVRLMDAMQQAILQASAGQQRDLLAERRLATDLTREECLDIAAAKAGALLSLACRMGAMCASVEEAQVENCAEAGRLLGIAAQLDNDAHDLYGLLRPAGASGCQKSDLARGKKTLPVVLAAHVLQATCAREARDIDFRHLEMAGDEERKIYQDALHEGILTTWGMALLYRERARTVLEMVMGEGSISPTLCQVLGLGRAPGEVKNQQTRKKIGR